jgi:hypothetical protein
MFSSFAFHLLSVDAITITKEDLETANVIVFLPIPRQYPTEPFFLAFCMKDPRRVAVISLDIDEEPAVSYIMGLFTTGILGLEQ